MAFISWNGKALPSPAPGVKYEGQQLVNSARNAQGQVVAQKINRRMVKLSGITWNCLTPEEWKTIRSCIEEFSGEVTYYDDLEGKFISRKMYWGDYSAEPYWTDQQGKPLMLVNCTCSLIDMGYEDGA